MAAKVKNIKDVSKKAIAGVLTEEFGDVFNASRFAKKYAGELVYSPQKGVWYQFCEHVWRADELRYITQHAIAVTKDKLTN